MTQYHLSYYIVILTLFFSCGVDPSNNSNESELLTIPESGYDFQLYQRKEIKLSTNLGHELVIGIDDITNRQTILDVSLEDQVLYHKSVSEGDQITFSVGKENYILLCTDQVNFLIGEDEAFFSLRNSKYLDSPDVKNDQQKIEDFILSIESSNVTFIRNGIEHTSIEAADHLRSKWKNSGQPDITLNQFITNIASKSSLSGKPYQVKLENDSVITAENWYYSWLQE